MNFITRLLKHLRNNDKKILGRWNIDYCDKKINQKIDLANEDHCGTCGEFIFNKSIDLHEKRLTREAFSESIKIIKNKNQK
jgi:hypothetical protein